MIMYDCYQKLECARARILLEQVFADPLIRKNVGAAKQLHDIAEPDKPPDGIVLLLKQAKKQVKQHQDDYVKAANREIAKMQRIKENQTKLVGYFSVLLLTIGNFFTQFINNKLFLESGEAAAPRRLGYSGHGEVLSVPLAFGLIVVALMVYALGSRAAAKPRRAGRPHVWLLLAVLLVGSWLSIHSFGEPVLRAGAPRQLQQSLEVLEVKHKLQQKKDAVDERAQLQQSLDVLELKRKLQQTEDAMERDHLAMERDHLKHRLMTE